MAQYSILFTQAQRVSALSAVKSLLGECEAYELAFAPSMRFIDPEAFDTNYHEVITKAAVAESVVVFDDALYHFLASNETLKDKLVHINTWIEQHCTHLKASLDAPIALYSGPQVAHAEAMETFIKRANLPRIAMNRSFAAFGEGFMHVNEALACRMAGDVLLDAVDCGARLLVTSDNAAFSFFVNNAMRIQCEAGRDVPIKVLHTAQLAAYLMGHSDKSALGFKPEILA